MADPEETPKPATKPKVKPPKGVTVVTEADLPKDVVLAKWGATGPGYLPGRCSPPGVKVYCTADFPLHLAAKKVVRK